ncbi:hypothetical protein CfE428DRAFT_6410 [Chthoniobacter flavus Ellin428]|uniref:Uncharacterized protein n=1 Tax=Chthoniobacter flavus Ellin428 TaxID=497964 RepID=B4DBW9_9BACT|nr:hypothetical protein CfE428DRAFT_6410 [Chthoniobacter flavus Ellin428]
MDRRIQNVVQVLSNALSAFSIAVLLSACGKNVDTKVIYQKKMPSGVLASVYLIDRAPALLALKIEATNTPPRYYWIAGSPNVEFGMLKLRIDLSGDGRVLWISGTSHYDTSIEAAYDDSSSQFFTRAGVARNPSSSSEVELMHFEWAPFPERPTGTTTVFNSEVQE